MDFEQLFDKYLNRKKNISHERCMSELKNVLSKLDFKLVARAFLYSLKTRKLEYRSALGSLYFALAIPEHDVYIKYQSQKITHCYLCGWYDTIDFEDFRIEREKYGGVRHESIDYVLYDLKEFLKLPAIEFNKDDINLLDKILDCVRELKPTDKASRFREIILKKKIISSNKSEVSVFLGILGICGILSSEKDKCYQEKFVDEYDRAPVESKNDFMYPINRWHASDGINQKRLQLVFGEYM